MSEELPPLEMDNPTENLDAARILRILHLVERQERQLRVLASDFAALHASVLQLQSDVTFFTRRCEARGNLIREFIAEAQERGSVSVATAMAFLQELECAGAPVRSPSGAAHPAVPSFDIEDPTPSTPGVECRRGDSNPHED